MRRNAFTLLELILVLAVILILSALVYPSLSSMYGHYKVTAGADVVKGAWLTARSRAVEDGRPYRFSVIPGKGNYKVAPDNPGFWTGGPAPQDEEIFGQPLVLQEAMPEGIVFVLDNNGTEIDESSTILSQESIAPESWKTVAIFLPDGTARNDVSVTISARGAKPMVVSLRSLTGAISVRSIPVAEGQ